MDIQAAVAAANPISPRQNLAVSDHDHQIWLQFAQFGDELFLARFQRLEHGQTQFFRQHFDRRRRELEFAAFGLVRLRDNGDDGIAFVARQFFETGAGQFRRAHEDDSQRAHDLSARARSNSVKQIANSVIV